MTGHPGQHAVRVLIADDQKAVREALVSLIGLLPGIDVVGAAVDGDDAVRQAGELRPDVVLMDLKMPRCNGVEATKRLRDLHPGIAVVVLTTYSDDTWVFPALQAGARGFLTKDAGTDEIHRAITAVAAGHAQLDPAVQRRLLDALGAGLYRRQLEAVAASQSGMKTSRPQTVAGTVVRAIEGTATEDPLPGQRRCAHSHRPVPVPSAHPRPPAGAGPRAAQDRNPDVLTVATVICRRPGHPDHLRGCLEMTTSWIWFVPL